MGNCSIVGCDGDDNLSFTCNECGLEFCSEHRLPENHSCAGLRSSTTGDEGVFATGLQDKRGKKRGITDRIRSKVTRESPSGSTRDGSAKKANKSSSRASDTGSTANTDHRKYISNRGDEMGHTDPKSLYSRSEDSDPKGPFRFHWARWTYRIVALIGVALLVSVFLLGFTQTTVPEGVPPEIADPIEGVADASATFVGNVTDDYSSLDSTEGSESTIAQDPETSPDTTETQSTDFDRVEVEMLIHREVNQVRAEHDISALEFDSGLREIARYHSRDMMMTGYFAHESPDGETMEDRYDMFGYQCRASVSDDRYMTGGENLAKTYYEARIRLDNGSTVRYDSPQEVAKGVVRQWMNSPAHRKNMLRDYWEHEGIGVTYIQEDGNTVVYATQNFC